MAATNKVREELAQAFLAALKEDHIPWRACWTQGRPYNAVSGRRYKGVNTLRLSMLADERGYTDPRWCTFQQAKERGWKVRKGEHAAKVEYWAMYDAEEKKLLSWDEATRMRRDDQMQMAGSSCAVISLLCSTEVRLKASLPCSGGSRRI